MKSDDTLECLWELEVRLTDSASAMEKEAGTKTLSAPAAERMAQRAEGLRLARSYVWDAIRDRTHTNGNGNAPETA